MCLLFKVLIARKVGLDMVLPVPQRQFAGFATQVFIIYENIEEILESDIQHDRSTDIACVCELHVDSVFAESVPVPSATSSKHNGDIVVTQYEMRSCRFQP